FGLTLAYMQSTSKLFYAKYGPFYDWVWGEQLRLGSLFQQPFQDEFYGSIRGWSAFAGFAGKVQFDRNEWPSRSRRRGGVCSTTPLHPLWRLKMRSKIARQIGQERMVPISVGQYQSFIRCRPGDSKRRIVPSESALVFG